MRYILALLLAAFLALPAQAADKAARSEDNAPVGGFEGPVTGAQADTVAKALKMPHDARVVLTGNITSSIAGEKNLYIFKDNTGEITAHITPRQFKGNTVTPSTNIQISGKLDKPETPQSAAKVKVNKLDILN